MHPEHSAWAHSPIDSKTRRRRLLRWVRLLGNEIRLVSENRLQDLRSDMDVAGVDGDALVFLSANFDDYSVIGFDRSNEVRWIPDVSVVWQEHCYGSLDARA
jgi:hypothetical protein